MSKCLSIVHKIGTAYRRMQTPHKVVKFFMHGYPKHHTIFGLANLFSKGLYQFKRKISKIPEDIERCM
jgi:hypothetical protein